MCSQNLQHFLISQLFCNINGIYRLHPNPAIIWCTRIFWPFKAMTFQKGFQALKLVWQLEVRAFTGRFDAWSMLPIFQATFYSLHPARRTRGLLHIPSICWHFSKAQSRDHVSFVILLVYCMSCLMGLTEQSKHPRVPSYCHGRKIWDETWKTAGRQEWMKKHHQHSWCIGCFRSL